MLVQLARSLRPRSDSLLFAIYLCVVCWRFCLVVAAQLQLQALLVCVPLPCPSLSLFLSLSLSLSLLLCLCVCVSELNAMKSQIFPHNHMKYFTITFIYKNS